MYIAVNSALLYLIMLQVLLLAINKPIASFAAAAAAAAAADVSEYLQQHVKVHFMLIIDAYVLFVLYFFFFFLFVVPSSLPAWLAG